MMRHFLRYSEDKIRGLIFGTFLGDSIGAIFEGKEPDHIPPLHLKMITDFAPLTYTDDTQMTISVFEELVEHGCINQNSLKERFLRRFSPWRKYSGGMLEVIERWRNGEDIKTAAAMLYGGVGSFGDGAAMRAAPISAFFSLSNLDELAEQVNLCSVLTHTHSYGISGAVLQAVAVLLALNDVPVDLWMRTFFELKIESAYKIKLEDVERALRMRASPIDAARVVGNGSDALDAVPAAIYSAMINQCKIPESILFAVAMGGDTDTIGAMAGAIAGAASGAATIPNDWFFNLENEKEGMGFIDGLIKSAIIN